MTQKRARQWAVLIGINGYHESLGRLRYSVNDCRRLAEVLTTGDDAFPADQVLVLADDEDDERKPTYANIHSWLASYLAQPDENDTVLVFFAGHGREMDGDSYLVPADATLQTLHVTGIPVSYVQQLLTRCNARQKLLVLDACHSGAGSRDVSTMAAPMMETLSAGKGIYTITSCDVDELSHEWDDKKQGVFSYYLAEALSGSCPPDPHGRITAEAVYDWTFENVRTWSAQHRCSQNPQRFSQGMGQVVLGGGMASRHSRKPVEARLGRKRDMRDDGEMETIGNKHRLGSHTAGRRNAFIPKPVMRWRWQGVIRKYKRFDDAMNSLASIIAGNCVYGRVSVTVKGDASKNVKVSGVLGASLAERGFLLVSGDSEVYVRVTRVNQPNFVYYVNIQAIDQKTGDAFWTGEIIFPWLLLGD